MLGYYIDIHNESLASFIEEISAEKTENTQINFENARALGVISYDWERVLQLHSEQPRISGVHVADAMRRDGASAKDMSLRNMFRTFFLPSGAGFIETETLTAYDSVDIIKKAGGVPVIAHPKSIGNNETVVGLINYGAKGIEVYHPSQTREEREKYKQLASEYGIFITGGSDWHGKNSSPETPCIGCAGLDSDNYEILKRRGR